MELNRRLFLKLLALTTTWFSLPSVRGSRPSAARAYAQITDRHSGCPPDTHAAASKLGLSADGLSHIYVSRNGTPEQNVSRVIDMMGGIGTLVGSEDIVIIKPNAQWTGHATTNTDTIKAFIDLVMSMPDFKGEIIIAENHHYHPDNDRGWTTTARNGDFNLNELIGYYHAHQISNVTKYHWRDGGPNPHPVHGNAGNGGIVSGPAQGDGYVWMDEDYCFNGLKTKMTYPVFTSPCSGVIIDFKYGAWKEGAFTGQPVRLINFSALNHHGNTGITAAIKNYMGVVDLSCGFHGTMPNEYYNFHYIGLPWPESPALRGFIKRALTSETLKRWQFTSRLVGYPGPSTGALGGAIGHFMKTVRTADLNIIAAEYVGHESRWKNPVHAKTVLASTDPVALDYYAAKHVVLPLGGEKAAAHDPDDTGTALYKILQTCHGKGIGTLNEEEMVVNTHTF